MPLIPNALVPALDIALTGDGRFTLAAEKPERFMMFVFYRGLHCPICRRYLTELEGLLPEFAKRRISVLSTMPFGRPHFNEVLQSLDFVIAKNYPARGDA